ncbi:hypothetical protein CFP56_044081 [Quercus suber]|uniref:Uncharacterized protein n=1 Tax=Quercus suber TaxID=58331 RepID=A0AAW0IQH3_QUESU
MLFILNTLNPICIYVNLLNALLQGSSDLGLSMAENEKSRRGEERRRMQEGEGKRRMQEG